MNEQNHENEFEPPFSWSKSKRQYSDANGRALSAEDVEAAKRDYLRAGQAEIQQLANQLQAGEISLAEWRKQSAHKAKLTRLALAALRHGGFKSLEQAEYEEAGNDAAYEIIRLDALAQEIGAEKNASLAASFTLSDFEAFFVLLSALGGIKPSFRFSPATTFTDLQAAIVAARPDWFQDVTDPRASVTRIAVLRRLHENGLAKEPTITQSGLTRFRENNPTFETEGATLSQLVAELKKAKAPRARGLLPQPTFYEARTCASAISDGRGLRDWQAIEGMIAMLHAPKDAIMQTRFEPCSLLLGWWGNPSGAQIEVLKTELEGLEFDALVTYFVCLSWAIEEYQVTTSIDNIIEAIGRGKDARRSSKIRKQWRAKVWRWMLLFDSLAVIGARRGTWREPRDGDKKREKIDPAKLQSQDALLKIIGTRATEQGTFDNSAPPEEVSFVAGPWVNQFRGNREILSQFGNVRAVAAIPRGKPSGAWAACVGFALQQKWREQAAKTPITRITKNDKKLATQKFAPFTRRKLLSQLWRSDVAPEAILDGDHPSYAKDYWDAAMGLLKENGVIGYYKEVQPLKTTGYGWQDEWLDQPLDIRPAGETRKDAMKISQSASAAKRRGRPKAKAQSTHAA